MEKCTPLQVKLKKKKKVKLNTRPESPFLYTVENG